MLPNKWNNPFDKPTDSISWQNKDHHIAKTPRRPQCLHCAKYLLFFDVIHTFQANCSFPAPRHNYLPYFEVFVTGIFQGGTIAIGVGAADISGKGILPGWKPESYGYHADDGFLYLASGNGNKYGPTYATGDVVGCGITMANQLYFTKNGENQGVACTLDKTKLFPILGLDHASVSTNFGYSPFKYDPFTQRATPTTVTGGTTSPFVQMNETTVLHVISFLSHDQILKFAGTCKNYFKLSKQNQIWKPLVYKKWETVSPLVPITNYYEFFKQRSLKQKQKPDDVLIENCMQWEFECPAALDKFGRTPNPEVDHCSVCKKDVYLVHNMDQLREKVAAKQCVAIDFAGNVSRDRKPRPMRRGKVAMRR